LHQSPKNRPGHSEDRNAGGSIWPGVEPAKPEADPVVGSRDAPPRQRENAFHTSGPAQEPSGRSGRKPDLRQVGLLRRTDWPKAPTSGVPRGYPTVSVPRRSAQTEVVWHSTTDNGPVPKTMNARYVGRDLTILKRTTGTYSVNAGQARDRPGARVRDGSPA
jgi:hypothetical protein